MTFSEDKELAAAELQRREAQAAKFTQTLKDLPTMSGDFKIHSVIPGLYAKVKAAVGTRNTATFDTHEYINFMRTVETLAKDKTASVRIATLQFITDYAKSTTILFASSDLTKYMEENGNILFSLTRLAADPDDSVRLAVIDALPVIAEKNPDSLGPAMTLLAQDISHDICAEFVKTLGKLAELGVNIGKPVDLLLKDWKNNVTVSATLADVAVEIHDAGFPYGKKILETLIETSNNESVRIYADNTLRTIKYFESRNDARNQVMSDLGLPLPEGP